MGLFGSGGSGQRSWGRDHGDVHSWGIDHLQDAVNLTELLFLPGLQVERVNKDSGAPRVPVNGCWKDGDRCRRLMGEGNRFGGPKAPPEWRGAPEGTSVLGHRERRR